MEHLIFTVKGLSHPRGRTIAYLRYIPDSRGGRRRGDGLRFRRVYDTRETTEYLRRNFPEYLHPDERWGVLLQSVPDTEVLRVYHPTEELEEMRRRPAGELGKLAVRFAEAITREADIPLGSIGVSGSLLLGLATTSSDVDLVIYGDENCRRAYEALRRLRESETWVSPYDRERVMGVVESRWGETGIDLNAFIEIERAKVLHGLVEGRDYFIRLVKDWEEVEEEPISCSPLGTARVQARIKDDSDSIFTPCSYPLEECRFLEGGAEGFVEELASFRGRFTEQAREGEVVEARGRLERVLTEGGTHLRLLLGDPGDYLIPIG